MKIVHVITALTTGGAQMMLLRLLGRLDGLAVRAEVVALDGVGPIADRLRALGVPVRLLKMPRGWPDPAALCRLAAWIRASRADALQTWLYHADLVGGLAGRLVGIPVAWNLRHSNLDRRASRWRTRFTVRACARMARWVPAQIVCCSEATRRVHAALGYPLELMTVIPNGFDLDVFRPDPAVRAAVDAELGLPADAFRVGLVARFDPQKDHRTFLAAAARLRERVPGAHFVLCGSGVSADNRALTSIVRAAGFAESVHLLGERADVPRITAALDVATSSSITEGFPNAIGEAMAAGVPCVVTDVGDSAEVVGETGRVVPPRDPQALAAAWLDLHALGASGRARLGAAARRRIADRFDLGVVARRYESLYRQLAGMREAA